MFQSLVRVVPRRLALGWCALALTIAVISASALGAQPAGPSASHGNSLTLLSVLRAVTDAHPLVVAAEARVAAARARRSTAGTFGNPVLTYQVENAGFPGRATAPGVIRETSTFASVPLEQLWQRGSRLQRAGDDLAAYEADLLSVRRGILLDAGRAFHRLAAAQFSVEAADQVLAGLDSLLTYTRTRVREGATAEGDLLRLEVERDRTATDRAFQLAELSQARAILQPYLVGRSSAVGDVAALDSMHVMPDDEAVAGPLDVLTTSLLGSAAPDAANQLSTRALATRSDVAAASARARGAAADVGLQRALTVRQAGATIGTKSTGGSYSMIAGVSVPLPLFDQNRGEVQRARAESVVAQQELRWTQLRAAAEVVGAFESARILTERVRILRSGFVARAQASRAVALAAYREGAVPLLSVLDATRTLVDARLTYVRARYAQQDAVLALYVAAGFDPSQALSSLNFPRTTP